MFAYCGNNPISRVDNSGMASVAVDGSKSQYHLYGTGVSGVVALVMLGAAIYATMHNTVPSTAALEAALARKFARSQEEEEDVAITEVNSSKNQAYFPENPLKFAPAGLVMHTCVDFGQGDNGAIIKWEIPGTRIAIFEWDKDLKNGSHYHVMQQEWKNKHLDVYHYKAGEPVPEPWNTIYFGG